MIEQLSRIKNILGQWFDATDYSRNNFLNHKNLYNYLNLIIFLGLLLDLFVKVSNCYLTLIMIDNFDINLNCIIR